MNISTLVTPLENEHSAPLLENLPCSPLDFLQGINRRSHAAATVAEYCRSLPPDLDLRLVCRQPNGRSYAIIAEVLPWDSQFFDYKVAALSGIFPLQKQEDERNFDVDESVRALLQNAAAHGVRYLFSKVNPRDLTLIRALSRAGFMLIETRAYYHRPLKNYAFPQRFRTRAAVQSDAPLLAETSELVVNPFDRFHADPFIDPAHTNRLMREWVEASLRKGFADITLIPDTDHPKAFCTVKYHKDNWAAWGLKISQPVLSAVSPEFTGWFPMLISEISYHLKEIGAEHAFLATQVTNLAVIKSLERLGYHFGKAEHIFRVIIR